VSEPVKTRRYSSRLRQERAAATRERVLEAAQQLFLERGYVATTAREIAARAGVSVDTLYAAAGRKPQLMLELVERAISGAPGALPAEDRGYVREVRAAESAREKLALYARAVGDLVPRLAPLVRVLLEAAPADRSCAGLWGRIAERRAANMLRLAADLRVTGELRDDLTDQDVADIVWSTNAPEYFNLLLQRGWTPERYVWLLTEMWSRMLLG
jgi:AcrR family transcriptional regulator